MFSFRKKGNELQAQWESLKKNEDILNKIHNALFSGDSLTEEEIDAFLEDLILVGRNVEEYFADLDRSIEKKTKRQAEKCLIRELTALGFSSDKVLDVLIDKSDRILSERYRILQGRVQHYGDILVLKKDRLNAGKGVNCLALANDYMEIYLNERITILDIPSNIQSLLLIMLRFDLGVNGTLEELLLLAKKRNKNNLGRERKNKSWVN